MTYKDKLYELLPQYYKIKDTEVGRPLESLLNVIAEQADILEKDISELYEDWFIETCREWVVPYIGDLVAARNLNHNVTAKSSPRSWVCDTIKNRRRKGTLAVLEDLARDVTGWNSKAVEYFKILSSTQNMNNPHSVTTADMRNTEGLGMRNTPFNTYSHNLDIRHIYNNRGKYNISNIGLFLWRLKPYPVQYSPAYDYGNGRFTFNQIGYDIPLFNNPQVTATSKVVDRISVPEQIERLAMKNNLELYYGDKNSINIEADGLIVSSDKIVVANLTDWKNKPSDGKVAVDPMLGRILFSSSKIPKKVYVSYYYGFSSDVGARYSNRIVLDKNGSVPIYYVAKNDIIRGTLPTAKTFATFNDAIKNWNTKNDKHTIIEFVDNEIYEESLDDIQVPANSKIEIRSQEGKRPVLRLVKPMSLVGTDENSYQDSSVILDGLTIYRKDTAPTLIDVKQGNLNFISIICCTLVPSKDPQMSSLRISQGNDLLTISVDNSITGRFDVKSEAELKFSSSIVDGRQSSGVGSAILCHDTTIENCTIFGEVHATKMNLARNSIFTNAVHVRLRQKGMVQFCYVPLTSTVPRRFKCQPNDLTRHDTTSPIFNSEQFGDPSYAQLDYKTDKNILRGADDENEMGVFNNLQQSMKLDNLNVALDEYLLFGLETGIFPIT